MPSTIRFWSRGSSIGNMISTRRRKFRGIQSAEARKTSGASPFWK